MCSFFRYYTFPTYVYHLVPRFPDKSNKGVLFDKTVKDQFLCK